MTQLLGTLTGPGTLDTGQITRHEHHKITIIVSSYVSDAVIKIEDISVDSDNPINLDGLNETKSLTADGGWSFLIENERFDKLRVNFVSGDATIKAYYRGW